MDLGFITFLVVASGAFFVLWVLDVYLDSKFRHQTRRFKIETLKRLTRPKDQ